MTKGVYEVITEKTTKRKWDMGFNRSLNNLSTDQSLDVYEFRLFMIINSWDFQPGKIFTYKYLSSLSGMSAETVKKKIKSLVDKEYLVKKLTNLHGVCIGQELRVANDKKWDAWQHDNEDNTTDESSDDTGGSEANTPSSSLSEEGKVRGSDTHQRTNYITKRTKNNKRKEGKPSTLSKKKEKEEMAKKIIDYINEIGGRRFTYESNVRFITPRLTGNVTLEDCKKVVRNKYNDPYFDNKHFCPETLFRISKFEKYLNEPERKTAQELGVEVDSFISGIIGKENLDDFRADHGYLNEDVPRAEGL